MNRPPCLAVFVTPHGFGHAARACAVMEAIRGQNPAIRFEVFTTVPEAFFRESLGGGFGYHPTATDIGFVQDGPFTADLPATAAALDRFLPFGTDRTAALAERLSRLGCAAVLCDISPLGLAVARAADLPSVLVENFTWDWVYETLVDRFPSMEGHRKALADIFSGADVHIQAEPVCRPRSVDFTAPPVSRGIRTPGTEVRRRIGGTNGRKMILVSLGGVGQDHRYIDRLEQRPDLVFVIANAADGARARENVRMLGAFSGVYHPDLVGACDALVGKAGYSTVAEACRAGVAFGFASRADSRESKVLQRFIRKRLQGVSFAPDAFESGGWIEKLDELLARPRPPAGADGAERIAAHLVARLSFLKVEK